MQQNHRTELSELSQLKKCRTKTIKKTGKYRNEIAGVENVGLENVN